MNKFQNADKIGQAKALKYIEESMGENTSLNIEQHWVDNGKIDLFITATTKSNRVEYYAIECKNRWKYDYDFIVKNGAMLDVAKEKELRKAIDDGYRGCYLMTFKEGVMIWVLNDIDTSRLEKKRVTKNRTTAVDNGKITDDVYILPYDLCKYMKRLPMNN